MLKKDDIVNHNFLLYERERRKYYKTLEKLDPMTSLRKFGILEESISLEKASTLLFRYNIFRVRFIYPYTQDMCRDDDSVCTYDSHNARVEPFVKIV